MSWVDSTQTYTDIVTPNITTPVFGGINFGTTSSDKRQMVMYAAGAVVAVALLFLIVRKRGR